MAASSSGAAATSASSSSKLSDNKDSARMIEFAIASPTGVPVVYVGPDGEETELRWNPNERTRMLWSRGNHYPMAISKAMYESESDESVKAIFDQAENAYGECAAAADSEQRAAARAKMEGRLAAMVHARISGRDDGLLFHPAMGESSGKRDYEGSPTMTTLMSKTLATSGSVKFSGFGHVYPEDLVMALAPLYARDIDKVVASPKERAAAVEKKNGSKRGRRPAPAPPPVSAICSVRALFVALCTSTTGVTDEISTWGRARRGSGGKARAERVEKIERAFSRHGPVVFDTRRSEGLASAPPAWDVRESTASAESEAKKTARKSRGKSGGAAVGIKSARRSASSPSNNLPLIEDVDKLSSAFQEVMIDVSAAIRDMQSACRRAEAVFDRVRKAHDRIDAEGAAKGKKRAKRPSAVSRKEKARSGRPKNSAKRQRKPRPPSSSSSKTAEKGNAADPNRRGGGASSSSGTPAAAPAATSPDTAPAKSSEALDADIDVGKFVFVGDSEKIAAAAAKREQLREKKRRRAKSKRDKRPSTVSEPHREYLCTGSPVFSINRLAASTAEMPAKRKKQE